MVFRTLSSLLILCLTQGPPKSMAASVPSLAKLHALKHLTSKVVANELLKKTGPGSSNARVVTLAAALSPSVLTGFPGGSRLTVSNLLICHNFSLEGSSHKTGDEAFTPTTPHDLQHSRANTDSHNSHNTKHTRVKQSTLFFLQQDTQPS